eukprot:Nk52_evm11s272 gene=Nk52_evmTU11s272
MKGLRISSIGGARGVGGTRRWMCTQQSPKGHTSNQQQQTFNNFKSETKSAPQRTDSGRAGAFQPGRGSAVPKQGESRWEKLARESEESGGNSSRGGGAAGECKDGHISAENFNRPAKEIPRPADAWTKQEGNSGSKKESSTGKNKNDTKMPDYLNEQMPTPWIIPVLTMIFIVTSLNNERKGGSSDGTATVDENGNAISREVTWSHFYNHMLACGEVEKLEVYRSRDRVRIYLQKDAVIDGREYTDVAARNTGPYFYFTIGSVESFEKKLRMAEDELNIASKDRLPVVFHPETDWLEELLNMIPALFILGTWLWLAPRLGGGAPGSGALGKGMKPPGGAGSGGPFGGMQSPFQVGKARPTIIDKNSSGGMPVKFKDVAGMDEAKQEVMEFVQYLHNSSKFEKLGARIPKGALLVGPPGTGKTLLAKAVAGEANVPFFSMAGSDFVEMFVGVGPSRVRDLFAQARSQTPCILYIDEIDAIGKARNSGKNMGQANSERENTLNQLLVEMDGFNTISGVIILASTNRADVLDRALLRPGRFDRQIQVDLPDVKGRVGIFKVHLKDIVLAKDVETKVEQLALLTPGMSGADIANVCNEAALHCAREGKKEVTLEDFHYAIERVVAGSERKTRVMSPEEKKTVAFHEAGHAIVGWFLEHTDPLMKVSIVPRGAAALGYAQYLPSDLHLYTKEQLYDRMCMALGGRIAEEITFGRITTGAQDDLQKVTKIAYSQIVTYGMNNAVGRVSYPLYKPTDMTKKPYGQKLSNMIDFEVRKLVKSAYDKTDELLRSKQAELTNLAEVLLEKEVLKYDDVREILGPRPFNDRNPMKLDDAEPELA